MEHLKSKKAYRKWLDEKGSRQIDDADLAAVLKAEIERAGEKIEIGKTVTLRLDKERGVVQIENEQGQTIDFQNLPEDAKSEIAATFVMEADPTCRQAIEDLFEQSKTKKKKTDNDKDPLSENPFFPDPDETSGESPVDKNPFMVD